MFLMLMDSRRVRGNDGDKVAGNGHSIAGCLDDGIVVGNVPYDGIAALRN